MNIDTPEQMMELLDRPFSAAATTQLLLVDEVHIPTFEVREQAQGFLLDLFWRGCWQVEMTRTWACFAPQALVANFQTKDGLVSLYFWNGLNAVTLHLHRFATQEHSSHCAGLMDKRDVTNLIKRCLWE